MQKFQPLTHAALVLSALLVCGCGGHKEKESGTHTHADGTVHKDDEPHEPQAGEGEHAHEGETYALGKLSLGGATFDVTAMGELHADDELHVELERTAGPVPTSVRLWVGPESGEGALKAKAELHEAHFETHVELPSDIKSKPKLWVEVEAGGAKSVGSVLLPW